MGNEIWGFGGAPVVEQANAVNFYDLGVLGEPSIGVGDPFFITIRIYGPHVQQEVESQTGFFAVTEANPLLTHNWKFYEHVATIQPGFTCAGWVARAGVQHSHVVLDDRFDQRPSHVQRSHRRGQHIVDRSASPFRPRSSTATPTMRDPRGSKHARDSLRD